LHDEIAVPLRRRRLAARRNACRDGDSDSESENPGMTDPDDDPIEEILARSRDRAERIQAWLEQLRAGDPAKRARVSASAALPASSPSDPSPGSELIAPGWTGFGLGDTSPAAAASTNEHVAAGAIGDRREAVCVVRRADAGGAASRGRVLRQALPAGSQPRALA
jgi:hypothetical protein